MDSDTDSSVESMSLSVDDLNGKIQLGYRQKIPENIFSFYLAGKLFDVTLVSGVDNKKIPAHRLVLSAASPYFDAMFTNDFKEKHQDEIVLHDVHSVELKLVINAIYSSEIEINEENVGKILKTATLLQLTDIESECSDLLAENMNSSNCLTTWTLVEPYLNLQAIVQSASKFAEVNFTDVAKTHQFLLLDKDHLITLLKSENLNVYSEEEVFHALAAWINYAEETRKCEAPELLANIRLTQLKPKFLHEQVEVFCEKFNCHEAVKNIYKQKLIPSSQTFLEKSRESTTVNRLISIERSLECEIYCPTSNKWKIYKNYDLKETVRNLIILKNELYVFGYKNDSIRTFHKFDLLTGQRTDLEPVNMPHYLFTSVASDNHHIYIVDGVSKKVESYDLESGKWSAMKPINVSRKWTTMGLLKGHLFVVGGQDEEEELLNTVEYYNWLEERWIFTRPLNQARSTHAMATHNNCFYVVGGCKVNTVEFYDMSTKIWTLIQTDPIHLDFPACIISGEYLFVAGGQYIYTEEESSTVIKIDLKTFQQTSVSYMKEPKIHFCVSEMPLYNPIVIQEE